MVMEGNLMDNLKNMLGRLGLLAVALGLCALKFLYTFTLEVHATGGGAAYNLLIHDVYVVMTAWTVLLVLLVLSTGAASIKDMGSLKFLHTSYFLVMGLVAVYSLINDGLAVLSTGGAHTFILLVQLGLEIAIVVAMSHQIRAVAQSVGERAMTAARRF